MTPSRILDHAMKTAHRRRCRRAECRWNRAQVEELITELDARDPKAWKRMRVKREQVTTPIPIEDMEGRGWQKYIKNKFDPKYRPQTAAPTPYLRHDTQEVPLIPLGRRQIQQQGHATPLSERHPMLPL